MSQNETSTLPSERLSTADEVRSPARLGWAAAVTGLLVVVAAVAGLLPRWHQRAVLRNESRELAIPTVLVISPALAQPQMHPALPAEVRGLTEAPIYARASGFLKRWLVDIGSQVEAGQLLAEIDTPEVDQDLQRARAEVAQAEAALELAKTTASRWAELLKTKSVSEQETSEKQADLALKAANLQAAQANLQRNEELKSFARVTAPFAGTITSRRTDIGELVTAGNGRELFRLAQTSKLRVYVRVPQSLARSIQTGQDAELTVPEIPNRTFIAKVVRTAGSMDPLSRTLLTELEIDNAKGELLAGSFAQVRFTGGKAEPTLLLPSNTLLFRAEGPQVGLVLPDGSVELRNIVMGRDFGQKVEVLAGVTTSDRVILNPSDSLAAGTCVRIAKDSATKDAKHSG